MEIRGQSDFTVLMSFYQGSSFVYLDQALKSIWTDQIVKPAQVCLVQDGPVDFPLISVLKKWEKKLGSRLTLIKLDRNQGLAYALNTGLKHCKFDLVARMDADDISEPDRFLRQCEFMQFHTEVAVVGAQVSEVNDDLSEELSQRLVPTEQREIFKFAKLRSPLNHPAVMFRKSAILSVGGYPAIFPEDYALWVNLILRGAVLANLPNVLLKMRAETALKYRRGLPLFVKEINLLIYFKNIGFYSNYDLLKSFFIRLLYRAMPYRLKLLAKKIIYKT